MAASQEEPQSSDAPLPAAAPGVDGDPGQEDAAGKDERDEPADSESSSSGGSMASQDSLYRQGADRLGPRLHTELSDEDLQRYETQRGTMLPKGTVKKFIGLVIGQAVNPNILIGVNGLCKVFIGEMVQEALRVQKERGACGPLLPSHIHEAHRRLYRRMPNMQVARKAPWHW